MQQISLPSVIQDLLQSSKRPNLRLNSELWQTSRGGAERWEHDGSYHLPPLRSQSGDQVQNAWRGVKNSGKSVKDSSPSRSVTPERASRSYPPTSFAGSVAPLSSAGCVSKRLDTHLPPDCSEPVVASEDSSGGQSSPAPKAVCRAAKEQLPSVPQHVGSTEPDGRIDRLIQDIDAYHIIREYTKDWTRDELYAALFQDSSCATYGDKTVFLKEQERKPEPVRADFQSSQHFEKAFKIWASSGSHGAKEKQRRSRHRKFQSLLHSIVCELADYLAQQDPALVRLRKGNSKGAGTKNPGKDDQYVSNVYQIIFSRLVAQSEHEGRLAAEAIVQSYRQRFDKHPDDHQDPTVHTCATLGSPSKRRNADESPRKRVKVFHSDYSSLSSRMPPSPSPSPSVSFSSRSRDDRSQSVVDRNLGA